MDASAQFEALVPQPLDAEGIKRRRELEDIHEELLLSILALEEEWMLDNRIAFALRQRNAALPASAAPSGGHATSPSLVPSAAAAFRHAALRLPTGRAPSCAYRRACRRRPPPRRWPEGLTANPQAGRPSAARHRTRGSP